jgi:hypothetical protein
MLVAWPRIDYRHVDLSLVESLTPTVHSHWPAAYMEMKQWCLSLVISCSLWPRPPNAGGIHEPRKARVNTVALCKVCGVCFSDIIAGRPSRGAWRCWRRGFFDAAVSEWMCGRTLVFGVTDENHGYLPSSIENKVGKAQNTDLLFWWNYDVKQYAYFIY